MIKLIRNVLILVALTAAGVYLFFFALRWNPGMLSTPVEVVVWNRTAPVSVTVYPILVIALAAVGAGIFAYVFGFMPSWIARGRAGRNVRRDQQAMAHLESGLDLIARKDLANARRS